MVVKYHQNGQIIPVNSKGEKINHADHPVYITDTTDATKVLMEQPAPRILDYMPKIHQLLSKIQVVIQRLSIIPLMK